jgi:hypothetical protein
MKVARQITITKHVHTEKAIDRSRNLTNDQRISMVEDLRREMVKITHNEYPRRLRRVLTVVKRGER